MPGIHFDVVLTETEIADLADRVTEDMARRLARRAFRPLDAVPPDESQALAELHAVLHLQRAAARLADRLARAAAAAGAGYPDLGAALEITRQGARKRFPDLLDRPAAEVPATAIPPADIPEKS